MPERREHRAILVAILGLFALLGSLYSVVVPIFEASDEVWHYPMVEVIARTGQLPVQPLEPGRSSGPWRQEGSQPPLYYAMGAALTFWIDTSDMAQVRHLNSHVKAGEVTPERSNVNLVVHDPQIERFPWQGTVLAVHIVRFLSVALGVWAVYLTWALVHQLYPARPWLALSAAAVHAFTPMYLFISSSVNNDNLIVPLSTLALLLSVRRVRQAGHPATGRSALTYAGLGGVLGLALLTKASGIALLPLAVGALVWEAWHLEPAPSEGPTSLGDRIRFFVTRLVALVVPALLISGWWFYRNDKLYGDWLGLNAFYAVLGTRDVPASPAQLWAERFSFAAGYWGNFGGLNIPMPGWIYAVLNVTAAVALVGILLRLALWFLKGSIWDSLSRLWPFAWDHATASRALAWAWPAAVFVSWSRWATLTWSSQGRLIFSAISLWSLALVMGLTVWIPRAIARYRRWLAAGVALTLCALTIVALPAWIRPAYQPPTVRDGIPAGIEMTPLDAEFGETLELLSYHLAPSQVHPDQQVELYLRWRVVQPTATDHSIFIHLLGKGDRIVAQRDTFPGGGLLSTTQLAPDQTWTERHVIPIPSTAYTPDTLQVSVGVYNTATGERLAGRDDTARFGGVALTARDAATAHPLDVRFGRGIVLTGYDLSDVVVAPGETITVTLDWLATASMETDHTVSVQLIDEAWNKAAQSDAPPRHGQAPTSTWEVGDRVTETRALPIAPDAVPGAYNLRLAVYRVTPDGTLDHLPISLHAEAMPATALILTKIRIK